MRHFRLGTTIVGAMLSLVVSNVPAFPASHGAELSPTKAYLQFHDVLMKATNLDAIKPFMSKDLVKSMNAAPKGDTDGAVQLMQQMIPTVLHPDSEKIDGNLAFVTFSGKLVRASKKDPKITKTFFSKGDVEMVKESGNWRIKHQSWDNSADQSQAPKGYGK
ncbi:MAG TPA: hypothetical protein V6C81_14095 [Planktothrix sp.]|jgi:hypothetical protein